MGDKFWPARTPAAAAPGGDAHLMAISGNTGAVLRYLAQLLVEQRGNVAEIAVTNTDHQELMLADFPFAGRKRVIVHRPGSGNDNLPVVAQGSGVTRVFKGNVAALGRSIVNRGTVPVILYGADVNSNPDAGTLSRLLTGVPAWYLIAAGGAWDGRNGASAWLGSVSAVGVGGAGALTIAEW